MKGASMATGNGTTKWVIGVAASAVLAVAGWGVTAVLASRVSMLMDMDSDVRGLQTYAVSNDKRITRLETQYETIVSGIADLKLLLREHVGER
jgi:hypothetical protein